MPGGAGGEGAKEGVFFTLEGRVRLLFYCSFNDSVLSEIKN